MSRHISYKYKGQWKKIPFSYDKYPDSYEAVAAAEAPPPPPPAPPPTAKILIILAVEGIVKGIQEVTEVASYFEDFVFGKKDTPVDPIESLESDVI
jgi:hypothetical protein